MCELCVRGQVFGKTAVKIVGPADVPGRVAADSSALYARNLLQFVGLLIDKESKQIKIDWEDEIVRATCLTRDGAVVNPALTSQGGS